MRSGRVAPQGRPLCASSDGTEASAAGAGEAAGEEGGGEAGTEEEGAEVEEEGAEVEEVAEDPAVKAQRELEAKLSAEVAQLETQLRNERLGLAKLRDQVSESGKNGYFIVQAQVAEFLKKNEADQKNRVGRNKREFVIKMLDVVDGFRKAPDDFPAETERETNMHKNFGSIVNGVLQVFEKYGFKEISCPAGMPLDLETMEAVEGGGVGGGAMVVQSQLRSGWVDPDGVVVRKAQVVAVTE